MKILFMLFILFSLCSCGGTKSEQKIDGTISKQINEESDFKNCKIFFDLNDTMLETSLKANLIRNVCNVNDENALISKFNMDTENSSLN